MLASERTKKPSLVWQGSTLDNYTLRLTQVGLKRIIFQLPQRPGLKDFVKKNYQGNLQQAVVRSVVQLARDALYAGSISQPNFSRKLRVFETQDAAGRKYQILALPVSGTESAIIALRLDSQVDTAEYMTTTTNKRKRTSGSSGGNKSQKSRRTTAPAAPAPPATPNKRKHTSGSSGGNKSQKSRRTTAPAAPATTNKRQRTSGSSGGKKSQSRRKIALGDTPGKKSLMGAQVLQRWHQKGLQPSGTKKTKWIGKGNEPTPKYNFNNPDKVYRDPKNWEVAVKKVPGGPRVFVKLDDKVHMGHKLSAQNYWEDGTKAYVTKKPKYQERFKDFPKAGHKTGPTFNSKEHRKFMNYSPNYRFEWGSANSSDGAKMKNAGNLFKTPHISTKVWPS